MILMKKQKTVGHQISDNSLVSIMNCCALVHYAALCFYRDNHIRTSMFYDHFDNQHIQNVCDFHS